MPHCALTLLLLLLSYSRAQMTCPSGFLSQYWGIVNSQYIRCCTELAPGNLTCAKTFAGNTATDFIATCSDLFPALVNGAGLCNCGAYCTGNITPGGGPCTGNCLCTTYYCCVLGTPCNASAPISDWRITAPPTEAPTPAPPTVPPAPTPQPTAPLAYVALPAGWLRPTSAASRSSLSWLTALSVFVLYLCV